MKQRRQCRAGHVYFKSTDCPTCPRCEAAKKPDAGVFAGLPAPACRALQAAAITTERQLACWTEQRLLELHGLGPSSLPVLRRTLARAGLAFAKERRRKHA